MLEGIETNRSPNLISQIKREDINKTHFVLNQECFEDILYVVKGEKFIRSEEKPECINFLFRIVYHQIHKDLVTLTLNRHLCFSNNCKLGQ